MRPEFAIYRQLFIECLKHHAKTYDYLPKAGTKYPFIYIGNSNDLDQSHSDLLGTVDQTIHIYATSEQRADLDALKVKLHDGIRNIRQAFDYNVNLINYTQRNLNDNTDVLPLIHTVIDVSFTYTKGEQLNG